MPERWEFYFCRVNEVLSSIFVDLELRSGAPDPARPHLLWVWVPMRAPRPDGLSSAEEAGQLGVIEDALVGALRTRLDAVPAGRITGAGRREFYFYAPHAMGLARQVEDTRRAFPEYSFDAGDKPDPAWGQYLSLLYPNPRQLALINNRRVIEALTEAGDALATPRPITHWLYFADAAGRAATAATLAAAGFEVVVEDAIPDAEPNSLPLRAERMDRAERDAVDAAVLQILDAMADAEGEYDGWESPVEVASAP